VREAQEEVLRVPHINGRGKNGKAGVTCYGRFKTWVFRRRKNGQQWLIGV